MRATTLLFMLSLTACAGRNNTPAVQVSAEPEPEFAPTFVDLSLSMVGEEEELDMAALFHAEADCGDLTSLEPASMLGQLSDAEVICLEDALAASDRQTYKKKVSLLLMADAWAKEDSHRWATTIERHLVQFDRSDPDLCYKYARFLAQRGVGDAPAALRWADVALENRTRFPAGETTVARVYALLKLKAVVATQLWTDLERRYAEGATAELDDAREDARNEAKTLAREWLEFARDAGKDDSIALQLCTAAAGGSDYCITG